MKVLSYNILADCYSKYFMFKYVRHGHLNFHYRSQRIIHEITESNSDIICLQEVDHFEDFYRPQLERLGYDLHETFRREKDAVVVGYKREFYDFIGKEIVDYNDVARLHPKKSKQDDEMIEPRDFLVHNRAIICLIKHVRYLWW